MKSLHSSVLLSHFPDYKYNDSIRPWLIDYRRSDNIVGHQLAAFHYYWAAKMCANTGLIGLSFNVPRIPYCLHIGGQEADDVHIKTVTIYNELESESFSLVIASSVISQFKCNQLPSDASSSDRIRKLCHGGEIMEELSELGKLLMPEGRMIAALPNEKYAKEAGWSLFQKGNLQHVWTDTQFESNIINPFLAANENFELEEWNNLHNRFAFNIVLRKKNAT